jgi:D-serine deaminase-like pyridoxal phosphate-dependent protein
MDTDAGEPQRPIELGDRLEFIVPHCDPNVNLYDRLVAVRERKSSDLAGGVRLG